MLCAPPPQWMPRPGGIGKKDIEVGVKGLKEQMKNPMFVTKGGVCLGPVGRSARTGTAQPGCREACDGIGAPVHLDPLEIAITRRWLRR